MKKITFNSILLLIFLIFIFFVVIIFFGIETNKFNKLISDRASQSKNINLELNTIKFKIDPKKLSLFLETQNPKINYKNISIPAKNIKVYVDFVSLVTSSPKIKKINLNFEELNVSQISKLSAIAKPSTFKRLFKNNVQEGKLISEIEIFLNEDNSLKNFIAKGNVKDLKIKLLNGLSLTKTDLDFFADKEDILIKNINGNLDTINFYDGDIKLNLEKGIQIKSNFNSKFVFDKILYNKFEEHLKNYKFINQLDKLKADLNHNFSIILDNTYKVNNYNYKISGIIEESKFKLQKSFENDYIRDEISQIYFSNLNIQSTFEPKVTRLKADGEYSFNKKDFFKINLENELNKDLINLKLNFDYGQNFLLNIVNYKKSTNSIANVFIDLKKTEKNLEVNEINYKEENNYIKLKGLKFEEQNFLSFKDVEVKTKNNDFVIKNDQKILIKGTKFDATNLIKFFSKKNSETQFKKFNGEIEIDFNNIKVPMSEKLENFKLLGEIEKGKFVKILSKGDFGGNNFLEISMNKDKNTNRKYLEIYSDLTRPLLTEFNFFNGLSGGKLLLTSIIDNSKSFSKLKIENFKVINAPGVIKLLSLADLGGLADLAEGEGLSFDILEIDLKKNDNFLEISEILALGPSISVLMDGYQDENGLTSLRGTLIPAKTLNKLISKIPLIGDIIIPKEIGEGLFGISFKMKGPKGKIRTTINPIRTLTPRFIQKIVDRNKTTK